MGTEEYRRLEFHYGIIMLRTRRFQSIMDRLGASRISKPTGWLLLYVMPVAAAFGFYLFLSLASVLLSPRGAAVATYVRTLGPLANLGLPGINPYIPVVDGWIALIVAMIIHEGAHGIVARSLGLPVKASGLIFLLILPIGAFVDVDEAAIKQARPSYSARVLAAGAGINLIVGVVSLLLLVSTVSAMSPAANGIPISQVNLPSPAAKAGILPGDFITAVNGIPYNDGTRFQGSSWYRPGQMVNVTLWRQGATVIVPLTVGARPNTTVICQNPMAVGRAAPCTGTVSGFLGNISGDKILFASNGQGAFNSKSCTISGESCGVDYTPSSTLNSPQNITATFSGDTYNLWSLGSYLVSVSNAPALSGPVSNIGTGYANLQATSPRGLGYIGTESVPLSLLRSLASSYSAPLQNPWQYVCIPTLPPCQSRVPFSDALAGFYTSPLGQSTGAVANLLYWIFFLNFNLAIFNALPIYPLDGGQAFAVGVKALGRGKLSEGAQMRITAVATLAVLALILADVVSPYLFNLI